MAEATRIDALAPMSAPPSASAVSRLVRVGRGAPLVLVLAVTLYAGLKVRPEMRDLPGMRAEWGDWLDAHDFLKNAVGFAVLAGASHLAFPRRVVRNAVAVALLVAGLELAQRFLPERNPDPADLVAGWTGGALATAAWVAGARRRREGVS